ncbi:MAG: membrane protein insertion efficiency factor YidD [Hydrotalea sp.]|nr:membrane protein insertion efficiency factor YidD [Hydrotalea sp.]
MAQKILLTLIAIYRHSLAYFFGGRCRFTPSCSQYAAAAIKKHGAWHGGWLAVRRIARCHPIKWLGGGGAGHDPIP